MPFIVGFSLILAWLFNAFFNMHYTYFCAMLCYPILVIGIKFYYSEIAQKQVSVDQKQIDEKQSIDSK
jgi:hypothetical protein